MRVIAYEASGPAKKVLKVHEIPDPLPGPGKFVFKFIFLRSIRQTSSADSPNRLA